MVTLSIVIVSYNTEGYLRQCLASLYGSGGSLKFEIIVVDNNSKDGSVAMVRETFPQALVVQNTTNVGFATANNIGIAQSTGEYVLLLNSDTKVVGNALEKLVLFLDAHREAAVVAPRLVYPDLSDQGGARTFPTPVNALFGRKTLLARLFPQNRFSRSYLVSRVHCSHEPFEVDWVSGACMMLRRKALDDVGSFDENFFMYWEDVDLCFRIKQHGWKVFCIPEARVIHYEGKSVSKQIKRRCIIEFNKSAYRYYRKHHITSRYEVMNSVAMLGLFMRTSVLLAANAFAGIREKMTGRDVVERPSE